MNNNYDEIKKLLKASRVILSNEIMNESINQIKNQYGILKEQKIDLSSGKYNKKIESSSISRRLYGPRVRERKKQKR